MTVPAIFLIFACIGATGQILSPIVNTSTGLVRGKEEFIFNSKVYSFLGIPFAAPPIGELRYRKPIAVKPWSGIYDATEKSASCMQAQLVNLEWIPPPPYSEDCLYLNIWVPHKEDCPVTPFKAVMVWIYGGGFYSGSANLETYDGKALATYGNVIVASMNYRLGMFGFLNANIDEAPGNMGLYDQLLALRWIKQNAMAFGGDPDRITLFGHSFGSVSVGLHLLSPLSCGLFSRAIMQAGAPYLSLIKSVSRYEGPSIGDKFAIRAGCSNENRSLLTNPEEVVECLKEMDSASLAAEERPLRLQGVLSAEPTYGDEFLPINALTSVREGKFNRVELLSGHNSEESLLFLTRRFPELFNSSDPSNLTLSEGRLYFQKLYNFSTSPTPNEIADYYLKDVDENEPGAVTRAFLNSYSSFLFNCPQFLFSERVADANYTVYYYIFDNPPETAMLWPIGTTHFDEVPFEFGIPYINNSAYTKDDQRLSQLMMGAWTSFARTGKPELPNDAEWLQFDRQEHLYLHFKHHRQFVRSISQYEDCEFWDRYLS